LNGIRDESMSTGVFATSSTMVDSSILNISIKEQARTSQYCDTERDAAFRHTTSGLFVAPLFMPD
jgi:hypothetical protein